MTDSSSELPAGLAAPARRALTAAGYLRLDQLTGFPERDLAALHGMGAKALRLIRDALAEQGLSLR